MSAGIPLALQPEAAVGAITSLQSVPTAPTCAMDVTLSVSGYFLDSCWRLDRTELLQDGNTFQITIHGVDDWDGTSGCAQQPVPYAATYCVAPLPPGVYLVRAEERFTSLRAPPPSPESREIAVTVQCCTPTPAPVSDLDVSLAAGGSALRFAWSDVANAEDYVLYQDRLPGGCFREAVATSSSGQNVLMLPLPPQGMFYVLVGRNPACGEGLKR